MMKDIFLGSVIAAAMILTGCSGEDTTTELSKGYLVDSAVANADYDCVADGEYNKSTGVDGEFQCQNMTQVRFRIGGLKLGEIHALPDNGYVFPQDLVGSDDLNDPRVIAIAQLLQSLDDDNNVTNGIQIPKSAKDKLIEEDDFDPNQLEAYLETLQIPQEKQRTRTEAWEHLHETVQTKRAETNTTRNNPANPGGNGIVDVENLPLSSLTQDLKDAIAYMGNEERLAHDVYLNLYTYLSANGTDIFQLQNIAQSETQHVQTVQAIVQKYGLTEENLTNVSNPVASSSVSVDALPSGQYDIPAIQNLYDALYAKGITSGQDALEVGCMVEVTDINDLNEKIALAQASSAADVETAFTALRDASYNHYWAFDKGLQNMGVTDGCCSLGTVAGVDYCHAEYPQNSNGGGNDNSNGKKRGKN